MNKFMGQSYVTHATSTVGRQRPAVNVKVYDVGDKPTDISESVEDATQKDNEIAFRRVQDWWWQIELPDIASIAGLDRDKVYSAGRSAGWVVYDHPKWDQLTREQQIEFFESANWQNFVAMVKDSIKRAKREFWEQLEHITESRKAEQELESRTERIVIRVVRKDNERVSKIEQESAVLGIKKSTEVWNSDRNISVEIELGAEK